MKALRVFFQLLELTALAALVILSPMTKAQTWSPAEHFHNEDGVSGLVVNATQTSSGISFYRSFLEFWREKPDSEKYTLEIGERSSKRFGNQIWVAYGQKTLFLGRLPIKLEKITALGEQAADATYDAIVLMALKLDGNVDPDIAIMDEY